MFVLNSTTTSVKHTHSVPSRRELVNIYFTSYQQNTGYSCRMQCLIDQIQTLVAPFATSTGTARYILITSYFKSDALSLEMISSLGFTVFSKTNATFANAHTCDESP